MAGAFRGERGFALVELLVAMAMTGLVMAATVTLLLAGHAAHAVGTARAEATQSARVALERMGSELRQAGYDPQGKRFEPILVAEPSRVTLQRDLNENGVIDSTRERITYLLRGTVLRREAGGGAQPLAEGVSGLQLTYYDRGDARTTNPALVASVGIRIEVSRATAFTLPPIIMETRVRFRNEKRPTLPLW
jgi:prepilin-type N-terminal cleavage/methylation domain-containing protein